MLTIKNYHKLCNKPVGGNGWHILFCGEYHNRYEIKMVCTGKTSVTIFLGREKENMGSGRMAYAFRNWDGELTQYGVTSDWISDMDNMLRALNRFIC